MKPSRTMQSVLAILAGVAGAMCFGVGQAQANHVVCGDTITADTTVDSDLINCPTDGIAIGADDITLDLNGHTVDGDGVDSGGDFGIDNTAGHDGVTIEDGSIREFVEGVLIEGGRDNIVRDLSTSHQLHAGILVAESTDVRVEKNSSFANIAGIVLVEVSRVTVEHNAVSDNELGGIPAFGSDQVLIAKNSVLSNGESGIILFDSDQNLVEGNSSDGNEVGLHLTEGSDHNRFETNRAVGSEFVGVLVEADDNLVRSTSLAGNQGGILVFGSRNTVTDNRIVGCLDGCEFGASVEGGEDNLIAQNHVSQVTFGGILIESFEPDMPTLDTVVRDNRVRGAGADGFAVATFGDAQGIVSGTLLEGNIAIGSGDDGIDVEDAATTITRSIANRNHDLGIEAVPGVTDGGGNKASGNGNPLQCTSVFCV